MNRTKLFLTLFLASVFTISCEPDDICASTTPTTPKLILRFYDSANPNTLKSVENLAIQGVGNELIYSVSSTDSIAVPLKSQETATSFILTKNFSDPATDSTNPDQINLVYTSDQIYISRACGFKAQYELNQPTLETDTSAWIQTIELSTAVIENETKAHVKIYH